MPTTSLREITDFLKSSIGKEVKVTATRSYPYVPGGKEEITTTVTLWPSPYSTRTFIGVTKCGVPVPLEVAGVIEVDPSTGSIFV